MYIQDHMHRLAQSFKWGFLFDRIVETLCRYEIKQELTEKDKKTLDESVSFIEMVLNGGKQITTGIYQTNALESLMLYNKSLSVILSMSDLTTEINVAEIEEMLKELKNDLQKIVKGEQITSEKVKRIKEFFNMLRMTTLDESATIINGFYESRSPDKWELAPKISS